MEFLDQTAKLQRCVMPSSGDSAGMLKVAGSKL
jgi:hypothetical protein